MILTLPMAGVIKKFYPNAKVVFLGRSYTRDVVALSKHVDVFLDFDLIRKETTEQQVESIKSQRAHAIVHVFPTFEIARLAKKAGIAFRVGTTNRMYHWFTCNQLIRLSRKKSNLHEAQLNLFLLNKFNIQTKYQISELINFYGFTNLPPINLAFSKWVDPKKFNLILHPKSKGSAREWGLSNFKGLIEILPTEHFQIFISGTADDGQLMKEWLKELSNYSHVVDITGRMNLSEFIAFIAACDGLVAASTGPLHIAAALGKKAIGLFSSRKPIHPGRWAPIGIKSTALVWDPACVDCANGKDCDCIARISPESVKKILEQ